MGPLVLHSANNNVNCYYKVAYIFNITVCIHLMPLIPKDPKTLYEPYMQGLC